MAETISCFDIDGTLSRGLLFTPLVQSEHEAGYLTPASFDEILVVLDGYKNGEIEYEDTVEQLLQAHAKGLENQSYDDVKAHAEVFIEQHPHLFHKFGHKVVEVLHAEGHTLFVVTAEAQYLAEAVVESYGLDGYRSSQYEVEDGIFTGFVAQSLAHRSDKHRALEGLTINYAFGDSEGDTDMLTAAKHALAISPSPGLKNVAEREGWHVFDGDDEAGILAVVRR